MSNFERLIKFWKREKKPAESNPYNVQGMEVCERFRACSRDCPVIPGNEALSGASVKTKWKDYPEMLADAAKLKFVQRKHDCIYPIHSGRNANPIGKLEVGLCFLRFAKEI